MAHAGFMDGNLKPPNEIWGFGSWLLWMIATRATALVDKLYKSKRANAGKKYGWVEGHGVPTPSVVAWLLLAAELAVPRGRCLAPKRYMTGSTRCGGW